MALMLGFVNSVNTISMLIVIRIIGLAETSMLYEEVIRSRSVILKAGLDEPHGLT